ncbi:MAG: SDR family oxidoreductase [Anaerolineales bacterium]|nr:SDR family oxidoreductase [Anaerolineales bacterium]
MKELCMITGATSGIGKQTALEIAKRGYQTVIVGRNSEKCQLTVKEIIDITHNNALDFFVADLSSQQDIRKLVNDFKERYDHLDILINNAGGFFLKRELSIDGIEMTFALNHLGYFLLTLLLIDILKESEPSRIINVSSNSHMGKPINFEDIWGEKRYNSWNAYGQSKFANVLFTYELDRRLKGTGITVNALTPGFVATNIGRNNGFLSKIIMNIASLFANSVEDGAQTSVYLATSPEVKGVSGKYFVDKKAAPSDRATYDLETARRLWDLSVEITGVNYPLEKA